MTASMNMQGQSMKITNITTKDGCQYSAIDMMGRIFVQIAFDGETAWGSNPQTGQVAKKGENEIKNLKQKAKEFPSPFFNYKANGYKVELLGNEDINGTDCFKLKLTKGKKFQNETEVDDISISFISKDTYYEIASEQEMSQMGQKITLRTLQNDFKEVAGVMLPHTLTQTMQGREFPIKIDSYEINGEIDKTIFEFKQ